MTERKPFSDSWDNWIEAQIRVAMDRGEFNKLPGHGKPLPDHGQEFDPMWWVKQFAAREQVSILPPALELRRKAETELVAIGKIADEAAVRRRLAALNAEIGKFNATVLEGPSTNLAKLDVDEVVEKWRRARATDPR
ncbi:MAG: DUF1992 domain-containing protein [Alphaproteobacteria bacterium]|nr:DUF1992 domain-containing protein [Alphaproteobacteria bacterium]